MLTTDDVISRLDDVGLDLVKPWRKVVKRHTKLARKMPSFAEALNADPTARANSYHAQLRAVITDVAEGLPGVVPGTPLGMFTVSLPPDLLIRFKHLGNGSPVNHKSGVQDLLARQEYTQEMLDELEFAAPPTLVTCGYTIDAGMLMSVQLRRDCVGYEPWIHTLYPLSETTQESTPFIGMPEAKPALVKSKSVREDVAADDEHEASAG